MTTAGRPATSASPTTRAKPDGKTSAAATSTKLAAKPADKPKDWSQALVGQTLAHFEISAPLARGRSGYIFHARDSRTDTPVALKVMHPDFGDDDKKVQHFVEAMKTVLPLNHPHLLRIFGAGKTGKYCWVATEYIPAARIV